MISISLVLVKTRRSRHGMEGLLFKKGRGESLLGRHDWKQRWFIPEQGILDYNDTLNVKTHILGAFKGAVEVDWLVLTTTQ